MTTTINGTSGISSQSVSFTPLGVGAVDTTVQAKLQMIPDEASGFWPDASPVGVIQRLYDRVYIGGATEADGTIANTVKDWLETERAFTTRNSQLACTSTIGQLAILGGSRSSDSLSPGSMGCIGVGAYAINNNSTQVQSVYAGYFEARRKTGAGITHGVEIDVVNQGDSIFTNPFGSFAPTGMTNGLWIASGGEIAAAPASVAIGIVNNGAAFNSGIVFQANSITGTDGVTGTGTAVAFAKGHTMSWYNSAGNQTSYIYSAASSGNLGAGIVLDDGNASFVNSGASGNPKFTVSYGVNDVNYGAVVAAVSGSGVQFTSRGSDANIDIHVVPKGAGAVKITNNPIIIQNNKTSPTLAGEVAGLKIGICDGTESGWLLNPAAGEFVAVYPYVTSSSVRNRIWAMNPIIDIPAGFPATAWCFEGNINVGTADTPDPRNTNHAIGADMVSGGTYAPSAAFATYSSSLANRWKHGLWMDRIGGQVGSSLIKSGVDVSVDFGLDLSSATINYQGLRIGNTPSAQAAGAGIRQKSNGDVALFLQRDTDTAPTGNIVQVVNAANSVVLAGIDATGAVLTANINPIGGLLTINGTVSVGGDSTATGVHQSTAFRATGAAPTASAGQLSYGATTSATVGATGAAAVLPALPLGYININVAGTTAKIPYYNA